MSEWQVAGGKWQVVKSWALGRAVWSNPALGRAVRFNAEGLTVGGMDFRWVRGSPDALTRNIGLYGRRALAAVHAVAVHWGQSIQNEARISARWEDRTGNARGGLFFAVESPGFPSITGHVTSAAMAEKTDVEVLHGRRGLVLVTLGHTVWYGRMLELSRGGRYAVVMSTMERNLPRLDRMLKNLLR